MDYEKATFNSIRMSHKNRKTTKNIIIVVGTSDKNELPHNIRMARGGEGGLSSNAYGPRMCVYTVYCVRRISVLVQLFTPYVRKCNTNSLKAIHIEDDKTSIV